jgi:hypothetical protein
MDPVIEFKNTISRLTREAARKCDVCEVLENVTMSVGDLQNPLDYQTRVGCVLSIPKIPLVYTSFGPRSESCVYSS